jgi:hypothetical protein
VRKSKKAETLKVETVDGDNVEIPTGSRNSEEPQHFGQGIPGLYQEGKAVEAPEPQPISELIDESELAPGDMVPMLPAGTHVAGETPLAPATPDAPEEAPASPEPPEEAKK